MLGRSINRESILGVVISLFENSKELLELLFDLVFIFSI